MPYSLPHRHYSSGFSCIRRTRLGSLALATLLFAVGAASSQAADRAKTTEEKVLFPFDDNSLPFNKGLLLTLVPGRKSVANHGTGFDVAHPNKPVVPIGKTGDPDFPRAYFLGTVIKIGDQYRMWYTGWDEDKQRQVCYAISTDGINWEKPKLGLVNYRGNTQNNLVQLDGSGSKEGVGTYGNGSMRGASAWVLYEPEDPNPERRFKMIREVTPSQNLAAFSADGLKWKSMSPDSVIQGSGLEPSGLIKFNGCYYLNGHGGPIPHPVPGARKRMMVTFASYDFENWTRAGHVSFRRDPLPPRAPQSFSGHEGEQIHQGASLWDRGNVILGFYGQYHNSTNDRRTSTCDLGLVISSDAVHFKEPIPDFKILPAYEEDDGAEARLTQGQGFENIGDRTVLYYGIWTAQVPDGPTGVRIATWERDRLGYFSPAPEITEAHCISTPIKVSAGSRVFVNVDGLSAKSRISVELLDEQFRPIPGYSGADCVPLENSGLRQVVAWKGKESLETMDGVVRVRINWMGDRPGDARLYSVYVTPAGWD